MEGVKHSIRHLTPDVTNEKSYGFSFFYAFLDMISAVLRMSGIEDLDLSPQILIDMGCEDVSTAVAFATNKQLGFETIESYPLVMKERSASVWNVMNYQMGEEERYTIDDIKYFSDPDQIKSSILANFGEGGSKYPLVGLLHVNDFKNRQVAATAANGMPFHHRVTGRPAQHPRGFRTRHGVLIVGVDTTSENPLMHCCEVKSSHGKRWGIEGFSKVGFEVFEYVLVPCHR